MDASCKIQGSIHVFRLVNNMCPGKWVHIIIVGLFYRCRLMYSKFFIYKVIICTIPLILMDIAFIYSMITGGYEGNLKATILAVIVFHILLYLLSHKQVKLLIQVFKRNGFKEINNLFNMNMFF